MPLLFRVAMNNVIAAAEAYRSADHLRAELSCRITNETGAPTSLYPNRDMLPADAQCPCGLSGSRITTPQLYQDARLPAGQIGIIMRWNEFHDRSVSHRITPLPSPPYGEKKSATDRLSAQTLTLLKRTLTVVGVLLAISHMAMVAYLSLQDWQWQIANEYISSWLSTAAFRFFSWTLLGWMSLLLSLGFVYDIHSFPHRSRWGQILATVASAVIVIGGMVSGSRALLMFLSASIRPQTAVNEAFLYYYLLPTFGGLLLLLLLCALVQLLRDLWQPVK